MNHKISTFFLVGILFFTSALGNVDISNTQHSHPIQNEMEYINYLKAILGRNDQATTISQQLKELVKKERLSVTSMVDKVLIIFTVPQNHPQPKNSQSIDLKGQLLRQVVFQTPQLFMVTSLPGPAKAMVQKTIEQYQNQGKSVHVITGSKEEVARLGKLFDMEQKKENSPYKRHPTRKLEAEKASEGSTAEEHSPYLIKFFFILTFIFITIGTLSFISNMNTKKDTLLYAKFIADVGK